MTYIPVTLVFGLLSGIILNYLSDVLPLQRKLTRPVCAYCHAPASWKNYLLLYTCRDCGKPRSLRTYLVLVVSICLSFALWFNSPAGLGYWLGMVLLLYFGLVAIIDIEYHVIMDAVIFSGISLGLLAGSLQHGIISTLTGGLAGTGIMLVFYWLGTLFARYRAKKLGQDDGEEALGFGDVIIAGIIGLMLGWPLVMNGLFIGVLAGGIASFVLVLVLVATRRYHSMSVFTAYGPYLVLGAALVIYIPRFLSLFQGK